MAATATATANSSLLQCSGTDAVLSHVVKVAAQFDALRVADFSPKNSRC